MTIMKSKNNSLAYGCRSGNVYVTDPRTNLIVNVAEDDVNDLEQSGCYIVPPAYMGTIYYDDPAHPITITCATAGTFYKIGSVSPLFLVAGDGGYVQGMTADVTDGNGDFVIGDGGSGFYHVTYNVSYSANANNQLTSGYVYVNENPQAMLTSQTRAVQASTVFGSIRSAILYLKEGDRISMRIATGSDGQSINVTKYNFSLSKVSDA